MPVLADAGIDQVTPLFDDNVLATGSHFVYANSSAYGYAIVDIDADLHARLEEIERVTDPDDPGAHTSIAFLVRPGTSTLERV